MHSHLGRAVSLALAAGLTVTAQTKPPEVLSRTVQEAEIFRAKAASAMAQETLRQRSLLTPPHSHFAIGAAAEDALRPRYFLHEIVSEYSIAPLKGVSPPEL